MNIPQADQDAYRTQLLNLEEILDNAYWNATSGQAKDAIIGLTQNIADIITSLDQAALDTTTAQYATLKATVGSVNAKLKNAQDQINTWVHVVGVAAQVVGAIAQVLIQTAKVFPV